MDKEKKAMTEKEGHAKEKEEHTKEKKKHSNAKELKETKDAAELKEALQRLQAEFENSRKRMEKEAQDFAKIANAGIVKELLPLIDSIEAAEKHLNEQEKVSKEDAIKGMETLKQQLETGLKLYGLEKIDCVGKKFDPMRDECVMQGKNEEQKDGIVLEELQKGYLLNGKVLRHAKVKVNKI